MTTKEEEDFVELISGRKTKKKSKYKSKITFVDGIRFHSKGEARRWSDLKLLERGNHISELRRQVPYELKVGDVLIGKLIMDFVYFEKGVEVNEDWKGAQTPLSKWKIKHFEAQYGKTVRITKALRHRR